MIEADSMKEIMLAVSKNFPKIQKLFRNNVGMGWIGKAVNLKGKVIIENARPLHAGLCVGSSDLIGWTEQVVTPEMVGKKVAIFTAVEVKKPRGRASKEQTHFLNVVKEAGGISGICKNENEYVQLIKGALTNEQ